MPLRKNKSCEISLQWLELLINSKTKIGSRGSCLCIKGQSLRFLDFCDTSPQYHSSLLSPLEPSILVLLRVCLEPLFFLLFLVSLWYENRISDWLQTCIANRLWTALLGCLRGPLTAHVCSLSLALPNPNHRLPPK